jgi:predicted transcriptional regulator
MAGTSPVLYESGNYFPRSSSESVRQAVAKRPVQFAWQSTREEEWAKDYYRRKRAEGKSHSVAVRALSNNWVRIIHAMWRNKKPYESTTFQSVLNNS